MTAGANLRSGREGAEIACGGRGPISFRIQGWVCGRDSTGEMGVTCGVGFDWDDPDRSTRNEEYNTLLMNYRVDKKSLMMVSISILFNIFL